MPKKNHKRGTLIWITGLPGSGKTTLAKEIYKLIHTKHQCVIIDGDQFRKIMGNDLGYSNEDRRKNAFRIARMNKFLTDFGFTVICSTVSLYKEIHAWNRRHIKDLLEIFINVPKNILEKRKKKLYLAKNDNINPMVGVNLPYDIPTNPHLIINNISTRREFIKQAQNIIKMLKYE